MATKTKPSPSVPQLQERLRLLDSQRGHCVAALDNIERREAQYQQAVERWGPDEVARMIERGPTEPGVIAAGWFDWRACRRPEPEEKARAEEILAEVQSELARVREELRGRLPYDPIAACRDAGASYYACWRTSIGGATFLPGEPVSSTVLAGAGMGPSKIAQLIRTRFIKEIE